MGSLCVAANKRFVSPETKGREPDWLLNTHTMHAHWGKKITRDWIASIEKAEEKGTARVVATKSIMLQLCATLGRILVAPDKNLLNRCVLVIKSST